MNSSVQKTSHPVHSIDRMTNACVAFTHSVDRQASDVIMVCTHQFHIVTTAAVINIDINTNEYDKYNIMF